MFRRRMPLPDAHTRAVTRIPPLRRSSLRVIFLGDPRHGPSKAARRPAGGSTTWFVVTT